MYNVEHTVGRLLEIRLVGEVTFKELTVFRSKMTELFVRTQDKFIGVADLRDAAGFPEDVLPLALGLMKSDNPRFERVVHLHREGSTIARQLGVLVGKVNHPSRREYFTPIGAYQWLDEVVTPEEKARLRAFVESGPSGSERR